jgi:hypothetical protein
MSSDQQQPGLGIWLPNNSAWNVVWSYAVLRFTLGITFFFQGLTRLVSGWSAFWGGPTQVMRRRGLTCSVPGRNNICS